MLNLLVSFAEGEKVVEKALRPDWRVLLDSGAFTNFTKGEDVVTLDRYVGYLRERGRAFWKYFALDRIADPEASRRNLHSMLGSGLKPVPVFQRGGKRAELDELKLISDVIGVGGIAGRLAATAHREYLHNVIEASAGHKLHLLGCGNETLLRKYRPFSSDSSSHALRHGTVWLWHNRRFHTMRRLGTTTMLGGKPISQQRSLFARLCGEYSIDPVAPTTREFYGRNPAKIVNLRSFMRFQTEMRRVGVEYFIACIAVDVPRAVEAWEMEKACGRVQDDWSGTRLTA